MLNTFVLLTGVINVVHVVGTDTSDEYSADISHFAIFLVLDCVTIMVLTVIRPHCVSVAE